MLIEGLFERLWRQWLAQFSAQVDDLCPGTFSDFHDHAAEEAEAARDHGIAFFQQVRENSLRAGEARTGDAERHLVFRLEDLAQQLRRFFQNAKKFGIDVTQLRRSEEHTSELQSR